MEFPGEADDWNVLPRLLFDDAGARETDRLTAELLAIQRDTGRIQDDWRLAVNGPDPIQFRTDSRIFGVDKHPEIEFLYEMWPKDLDFRKNTVATAWEDSRDLIRRRVITVRDKTTGEVHNNTDVASLLDELEADVEVVNSSLRWVLAIDEAKKFELHVQMLPASGDEINGKPVLKR
jgi:hypothetical protein